MDKNKLIFSLCLLAGLVFMGTMLPKAVDRLKSYDRTISVKGLCENEVMADQVIWPLTHKVVGDDIIATSREIEQKTNTIIDFLTSNGLQREDISVSTTTINDKYAQEYASNERRFRYVASCNVTVCSSDVEKVMGIMAKQNELFKRGIILTSEWDSKPQFNFQGLNEIKPKMIEEATRNAREVALKFAKDSDSEIGKIKDAQQGTFTISDRDANTPHIKKIRVVTYITYYIKG